MRVDLHVHSNSSADGEFTPKELVEMAKGLGLKAIAIADHDTVKSVEEGMHWGKKYGVEVLPACEFVSYHMGKILHMLGYYIKLDNREMQELFNKIEDDRQKVIDLQINKLREGGFFLDLDEVMKHCNNKTPYTGAYASALFSDCRNKDNQILKEYRNKPNYMMTFLYDYLVEGKPYYVSQFIPSARDIIHIIRQGGGVPVLGHPGLYIQENEMGIVDDLVSNGMMGMEVYTTYHNEEKSEYFLNYCRQRKLIFTCGSDFHGKAKPQVKMGSIMNNTYDVVEELKRKRKF